MADPVLTVDDRISRLSSFTDPSTPSNLTIDDRLSRLSSVEIAPPTTESEAGFFDNLGQSFNRGLAHSNFLEWSASAARGDGSQWETAKGVRAQNAKDFDIAADNWLSRQFHNAASILAPMTQEITQASKTGAAVAGVAAVTGAPLLATPLAPVEGVSIVSAFTGGTAVAASLGWYELAVGDIYATMRDDGIDHSTASTVAQVAGIPYSLIEASQVGRIIPFAGAIKRSLFRKSAEVAKRFAKDIAIETGQEVAQKGVELASSEIGKWWVNETNSGNLQHRSLGEWASTLAKEGRDSATPLAILLGPKAAFNLASIRQDIPSPFDEAPIVPEVVVPTKAEKELDNQSFAETMASVRAEIEQSLGDAIRETPQVQEDLVQLAKDERVEGEQAITNALADKLNEDTVVPAEFETAVVDEAQRVTVQELPTKESAEKPTPAAPAPTSPKAIDTAREDVKTILLRPIQRNLPLPKKAESKVPATEREINADLRLRLESALTETKYLQIRTEDKKQLRHNLALLVKSLGAAVPREKGQPKKSSLESLGNIALQKDFLLRVATVETEVGAAQVLEQALARLDIFDRQNAVKQLSRASKKIGGIRKFLKLIPRSKEEINRVLEDLGIPGTQAAAKLSKVKFSQESEVTTEEIYEAVDAINVAVKADKLTKKFVRKNQEVQREQVINEVVASISARATRFSETKRASTISYVARDLQYHGEDLVMSMENSEKGPLKQYHYDDIQEARTGQLRRFKDATVLTNKITKQHKDQLSLTHTFELASGQELTLSSQQMITFLGYASDPQTRSLLMDGNRIVLGDNLISDGFAVTLADMLNIINDASNGEMVMFRAMKGFMNGESMRGDLNAKWLNRFGSEKAPRDDYWPRFRNRFEVGEKDISESGNLLLDLDPTITSMGMVKERVQDTKRSLVVGDANKVFQDHVWKVSGLIEFLHPLANAKAIMDSPKVRTEITKKFGPDRINILNERLKNITKSITKKFDPLIGFDKVLAPVLDNITVAMLGANPSVIAKQPVSLMGALTEIEAKYLLPGVFQGALSQATATRMEEHSPQLWYRYQVSRILLTSQRVSSELPRKDALSKLREGAMKGIAMFDKMAILSIWRASEKKVASVNPKFNSKSYLENNEEYWKEVDNTALQVIRRTQPVFDTIDISTVAARSRSSALNKMFVMFSTQLNANYNILTRSVRRYVRGDVSFKKMAATVSIIAAASPLLINYINKMRTMLFGRDQEEEEKKNPFINTALEVMKTNISYIYGTKVAQDVVSSLIQMNGGKKAFRGATTPLGSVIDSAVGGAFDAVKALGEDNQKKQNELAVRGVKRLAIATSHLLGVPAPFALRAAFNVSNRLGDSDSSVQPFF